MQPGKQAVHFPRAESSDTDIGKSGWAQTLEEFLSDLMGGELGFYAPQRDYL